jgi:hypothetical protein
VVLSKGTLVKTHHNNSGRALTLVEVLIIVAMLALMAVMLFPVLRNSNRSREPQCVNNLKAIGLAFRQFPNDSNDRFPMACLSTNGGSMEYVETGEVFRHFQVLSNELASPKLLICPADKARRPAMDFNSLISNTNISYFVGVDAEETSPSMFLTGDRNLTNGSPTSSGMMLLTTNSAVGWTEKIHVLKGFIGLADGSVQFWNNTNLQQSLASTGVATNRLAMPVE